MTQRLTKTALLLATLFCLVSHDAIAIAGTSGMVSGFVRDKETGAPLAGANIFVEGMTLGAMADKSGYYVIHNVPVGNYDLRAKMIGYTSVRVVGVVVNVDMNTRLDFGLTSEVLQLGQEVVVVAKRPFVYSELSSSIHFVPGTSIAGDLPLDGFNDAVGLVPGVVQQHFRGGRRTDAAYLVDGLPVQGALTRELASFLPNSSIVEMMVQTGGFNAEYGHATSGVVNLVTQEGKNTFEGLARLSSDLGPAEIGSDNTQRLEGYIGGPITLGLAGPVLEGNYLITGDVNLTDTPWRDDLNSAFKFPIFRNYNLNSKFTLRLTSNLKLVLQSLLSNSRWRQFDPQWSLNPKGLPLQAHNSSRLSIQLTHTLNPRTFYTLSLSRYDVDRSVESDSGNTRSPVVEFQNGDPGVEVLSGNIAWDEQTNELMLLAKADVVHQLNSSNQIKFGGEFQYNDVSMFRSRFEYLPLTQSSPGVFVYSGGTDRFHHFPKFAALYLQDKMSLGKIILNLGLRYDVFDPDIAPEQEPSETGELTILGPRLRSALSPRLSVSFPVLDNNRIHFNYGWFQQMPPLFYLYTNSSADLSTAWPLVGNANLKPTRTEAMELSYKRVISEDAKFIVTLFRKRMANLVDSRVYSLPDTMIAGVPFSRSYAKYANAGRATAWGVETTVDRDLSSVVSARFSYTLMRAVGTSSSADGGFAEMVWGVPQEAEQEVPLSWDQRHTVILDLDIHPRNQWQINILGRLFSPLPVTTPGSSVPNDGRTSWRTFLDARVSKSYDWEDVSLRPFVEIRNLFSAPDDSWQNRMGVPGGELFDPFLYDIGRRVRLGVNFVWR